MNKEKTGNCVVCKNKLTVTYDWNQAGEMIFGPENQGCWDTKIRCDYCGLSYVSFPKEDDE